MCAIYEQEQWPRGHKNTNRPPHQSESECPVHVLAVYCLWTAVVHTRLIRPLYSRSICNCLPRHNLASRSVNHSSTICNIINCSTIYGVLETFGVHFLLFFVQALILGRLPFCARARARVCASEYTLYELRSNCSKCWLPAHTKHTTANANDFDRRRWWSYILYTNEPACRETKTKQCSLLYIASSERQCWACARPITPSRAHSAFKATRIEWNNTVHFVCWARCVSCGRTRHTNNNSNKSRA